MFIISNCSLIILPITQGLVIVITLAGFLAGGVSLLSTGDINTGSTAPFPGVTLTTG